MFLCYGMIRIIPLVVIALVLTVSPGTAGAGQSASIAVTAEVVPRFGITAVLVADTSAKALVPGRKQAVSPRHLELVLWPGSGRGVTVQCAPGVDRVANGQPGGSDPDSAALTCCRIIQLTDSVQVVTLIPVDQ